MNMREYRFCVMLMVIREGVTPFPAFNIPFTSEEAFRPALLVCLLN